MATSYVDSNLTEGEQLIYRAHLHPIIFAGPIVFAAIGLLAIGIALVLSRTALVITAMNSIISLMLMGLAVLALSVLSIIAPFIAYKTSEFAITNRRVLIKIGWLRRKSLELLLQKVESVSVDQSMMGRMLNFGNITVRGTGGSRERFVNIAEPLEFRRQVQASADEEHIGARPLIENATFQHSHEANPVRETKKCPHCISDIPAAATVCRFCARDVGASAAG